MEKYILILLVGICISCNQNASAPFVDETAKTLRYLEGKMESEGIPGLQVVVIKNDEIVLSENLGLANVPFSVEVEENALFPICSLSKIFASTAILQLAEQGKLSLSDPISKHLSDLPMDWRSVSIRQLLSHTSGLPDIEDPNVDGLIGGKSQDSAWIEVQTMPLEFKAGEAFHYNASNYLLIQKIVEKYGPGSYEAFIKRNQFDLAAMEQVVFANSFDVKQNKCPTYLYYYRDETTGEYVKGVDLLETKEEFPSILRADSGAFSSAKEMAKWVIALQTGKLLTPESIQQMWTPVKLNNGTYGGFGEGLDGYALGWPVLNRVQHPAVVAVGGGRASLAIYPEDDLAIILLTNLTGILAHEMTDEISQFFCKK
ncbi:MAG: serine hydrolase domain-containing protein [Bacteroidota bacterium]